MLVPVVEALALRYPDLRITVVSRPMVESIFRLLPANVQFVGINPRNYAGVRGLWRMFTMLHRLAPTHVADMHNVLRTIALRHGFLFTDVKMRHINKDRAGRRAFLEAPVKQQQTSSFERYAEVLRRLGFPIEIDHTRPAIGSLIAHLPEVHLQPIAEGNYRIGIAPFAAHRGKIYPKELMEQVVEKLTEAGHHVYLFGAGSAEKDIIAEWTRRFDGAHSVVGKFADIAGELKLMSQLHLILTMDSGNMHLAALSGRPVVSIWGATHPLGGFLGWGCSPGNILQCSDLSCRPCSIFGKAPCRRGDYACLYRITPEHVVQRIYEILTHQ